MRCRGFATFGVLGVLALATVPALAANIYGLQPGAVKLKSASVLAFGPDGILFIGDPIAATVYAVETGDKQKSNNAEYQIEELNQKIAEHFKVEPGAVTVSDLAVNPATGHVFLAVNAGSKGTQILKIDGSGQLSELDLSNIESSHATLPDAAENKVVGEGRRRRNNRESAITDLAFMDGEVLVSGMSSDGSPSSVWSMTFPFRNVTKGTSIEIYHGAHGRSEDDAAIRTFVPFIINGEPTLLAGFTCTPLVKFPINKLKEKGSSGTVKGTTVAELGNHNRPRDMIAYQKDGKDFLLLSNSARGVMKINTQGIGENQGITNPVRGGGTAGQEYETLEELKNEVTQMDRLGEDQVVMLLEKENGQMNLKTMTLP